MRTAKNHLISTFTPTHPDLPDDLWDRLLPHAELTLDVLRPWRPDPSLSAWSGLHHLPYDFVAHPLHPPANSVYPSTVPTTAFLGIPTGTALTSLALPSITTAVTVYTLSPPVLNASP